MLVNDIKNLSGVIDRIKKNAGNVEESISAALNRSSTFAIKESIEQMTSTVRLSKSYINRKLNAKVRATPQRLRTEVWSEDPRVLLSQYPFTATRQGVAVSVNVGGGMRKIPKAFVARNLKGSFATGIAMSNVNALAYFENMFSRGKSTKGKLNKLKARRRAVKSKPKGIYVNHGKTINQLFRSAREDIQPELKHFLVKTFLEILESKTI